ncbi:NAD(P)/FAD-dependent oxidoreductase [Mucilaginibacter sp. UC70_90]
MKDFDVIIIGGSSAGLSAGMALGRAMRKVLIIDSGMPCNRQTPHSHNFFTRDGQTPHEILTIAREQTLKYPTITLLHSEATQCTPITNGFEVSTRSGETFSAKKIILAAGIKDQMPDIPGFAECWEYRLYIALIAMVMNTGINLQAYLLTVKWLLSWPNLFQTGQKISFCLLTENQL